MCVRVPIFGFPLECVSVCGYNCRLSVTLVIPPLPSRPTFQHSSASIPAPPLLHSAQHANRWPSRPERTGFYLPSMPILSEGQRFLPVPPTSPLSCRPMDQSLIHALRLSLFALCLLSCCLSVPLYTLRPLGAFLTLSNAILHSLTQEPIIFSSVGDTSQLPIRVS